jgi:hypothetical protein
MSIAIRRITPARSTNDRRMARVYSIDDRRAARAPHPVDYRLSPSTIAATASLAGIAAACIGIEIYAWLAHVPGIEVIFG